MIYKNGDPYHRISLVYPLLNVYCNTCLMQTPWARGCGLNMEVASLERLRGLNREGGIIIE